MSEEKTSSYIIVGVIVIFILFIAGFLLISTLKIKEIKAEEEEINNSQEQDISENCKVNEDCNDDDACTIESCTGGVCITGDVVLCYNNDGCCPVNCNSANDNDCLRKEYQ